MNNTFKLKIPVQINIREIEWYKTERPSINLITYCELVHEYTIDMPEIMAYDNYTLNRKLKKVSDKKHLIGNHDLFS